MKIIQSFFFFFFWTDTNIFQITIFSKSHLWLWCQIHVNPVYLHVFIPKLPLPLFIRRQIIFPDRFCTRGNMQRAFPVKYHHRFCIGVANPSFRIKPLGKCLSLSSWAVWSVSKMDFFWQQSAKIAEAVKWSMVRHSGEHITSPLLRPRRPWQ